MVKEILISRNFILNFRKVTKFHRVSSKASRVMAKRLREVPKYPPPPSHGRNCNNNVHLNCPSAATKPMRTWEDHIWEKEPKATSITKIDIVLFTSSILIENGQVALKFVHLFFSTLFKLFSHDRLFWPILLLMELTISIN